MYVIVTNYVNWQRENLRSDRENTGNLKYNLSGYPVLTLPLTSDYQEVPRTVPGSREAGEGGGVTKQTPCYHDD